MKKGILISIVLLIIIIAGVLAVTRVGENKKTNQNTNSTPVNSANTNSQLDTNTDVQSENEISTFNITGSGYDFSVEEIRVRIGDRVRINFTSTDGIHDWNVDEFNASTDLVDDGESDSVEFVADQTGTFEYYCSVEDHRSMGMVGKLIVE